MASVGRESSLLLLALAERVAFTAIAAPCMYVCGMHARRSAKFATTGAIAFNPDSLKMYGGGRERKASKLREKGICDDKYSKRGILNNFAIYHLASSLSRQCHHVVWLGRTKQRRT
tara:strand:- start:2614 stop:2961 length:348 start_codon:yes stop_codon:yes gene_type:complete